MADENQAEKPSKEQRYRGALERIASLAHWGNYPARVEMARIAEEALAHE